MVLRTVMIPWLILVITCATPVYAQSVRIDSLQKLLDQHPVRDTLRTRLLAELSREHQRSDPDRALRIATEAIETGRECRADFGIAKALLVRGGVLLFRGQFDRVLDDVRQARQYARRLDDAELLASCDILEGGIHVYRGENQRAVEILAPLERGYRERGNRQGLARVLANLAMCHTYLGNTGLASDYRLKSLRLYEEQGDSLKIGQTLMELAILESDHQQQLTLLQRARPLIERGSDIHLKAVFSNNFAQALMRSGAHAEALDHFEHALALAERLDLSYLIGGIAMNMATLYRELQQHDRALRNLLWARSLAEKYDLSRLKRQCLVNLGVHYNCVDKADSAVIVITDALARGGDEQDLYTTKYAYEALSIAYDKLGRHDEALTALRNFCTYSDSLYDRQTIERIENLEATHSAREKQLRIDLLEKEQALQRRMLQNERQLAANRAQSLELLAKQNEIQKLDAQRMTAALRITGDSLLLARNTQQLQDERIERAGVTRNALVAGSLLLLLVAVLIIRQLRQRKKQSDLRAEAALLRTRAAEADALSVRAEMIQAETEARRAFTQELIRSQEQERKRIAAELHDQLSQDLLVLKNRAELLLGDELDDAARLVEISRISEATSTALQDIRRISRNLRPYLLERIGLSRTIEAMLQDIDTTSTVAFSIVVDAIDDAVAPGDAINIIRIIQEATNNILKHASADRASVEVTKRNGHLRIVIRDNGLGFDASLLHRGISARQGFGLQGMHERVEILGGNMNIDSAPGKGTAITIFLPAIRQPLSHTGSAPERTSRALSTPSAAQASDEDATQKGADR